MRNLKRISYAALMVAGLIGTGYVAHADTANQRVVAHHCKAEDDWAQVGLRDYSVSRVVLKCGAH